jgi:hypothetical protein
VAAAAAAGLALLLLAAAVVGEHTFVGRLPAQEAAGMQDMEQKALQSTCPLGWHATVTSATGLCSQGGLPYQVLLGLHMPNYKRAAQHQHVPDAQHIIIARAHHSKWRQHMARTQALQQMLTSSSVKSLHLARNCSLMEPRRFAAATGPSFPGPGSTVAASAPSSSCGAWQQAATASALQVKPAKARKPPEDGVNSCAL